MIRRTRSGVGLELPEVSRSTIDIDADPAGFDDIAVEVVALAQSLVNPETLSSDRWRISGEFDWRLRRATGVAKAAYVAEFVRMVIETGEPVLLGGWHHDVYEIWADKLKDLNPAFFTGKETPKQKEATKQAFLNGDTDLMIMSLRSGAGTDGLQKRASTVVFGELDWSPAVHDQFIGRLNRDGAIAPVQAFFMVSGQGADPAMVEVLQLKRQQAEALVGTETGTATQKPITQQARIRALAESFLATRGNPPAAQPSTPSATSCRCRRQRISHPSVNQRSTRNRHPIPPGQDQTLMDLPQASTFMHQTPTGPVMVTAVQVPWHQDFFALEHVADWCHGTVTTVHNTLGINLSVANKTVRCRSLDWIVRHGKR